DGEPVFRRAARARPLVLRIVTPFDLEARPAVVAERHLVGPSLHALHREGRAFGHVPVRVADSHGRPLIDTPLPWQARTARDARDAHPTHGRRSSSRTIRPPSHPSE